MQLSRYALCGLLDPAARGLVPGLVALTSGHGYLGGGAPYKQQGEKGGKLHIRVQPDEYLLGGFHPKDEIPP